jgi:hypothetical protein
MKKLSTLLHVTLFGLLLLINQSCTKEETIPIPTSISKGATISQSATSKGSVAENDSVQVRKEVRPATSPPKSNGKKLQTYRTIECYENWDIYYNTYTGEIVSEEYVNTVCTGGSGVGGGGGDGSGGGGGSSGDGGVSDNGVLYSEPTAETVEPDLPSDCSSWNFRAVGPSGYMACGVTDIEVDLLSQFRNADGTQGAGINYYQANLFFEMPPHYTPGQAATICAQIKDEVEELLEDRYRYSYPPDIAQTINSLFIREMQARISRFGGRITQTAQYPNTPVSQYQHTFSPNNGGCS